MSRLQTSRAFISYSSRDKPLARRVARRLAHRGVSVWLDENEMQVGDRLSDRLASEILSSTHLLVLLTENSCNSKWVAQEIEVARSIDNSSIVILPLLAQENLVTMLATGSLGVSIAEPLTFEDKLDTVAQTILGEPICDNRDLALLRCDLQTVAGETPEIRPLIEQMIKSGQVTHAQLEAIAPAEEIRHPLETALIALHECSKKEQRYVISLIAAHCFRKMGIGYDALRRQVALESGDSDELRTMFNHLGDEFARPADIDGAFRLFEMASPPKDYAFAQFVRKNFQSFNRGQQERAVRFVTTPDRGPAGFAAETSFELFARLPDSRSLHALWWFWVHEYKFGGKAASEGTQDASIFFGLMNTAAERGFKQFDPIMDNFENCFRSLARGGEIQDFMAAVFLLDQACIIQYVRREGLARQLNDALFSAETGEFKKDHDLRRAAMGFVHDVSAGRDLHEAYIALCDAALRLVKRGHPDRPLKLPARN